MDLHRLRVVEFDTSVSEKEGEKKYIAEHEKYKQEDWKSSTDENKDKTFDENLCLGDKISPPGPSKKYLNGISSAPGTSKKCPDDNICPPGTSKKDNFARSKSKSEIFKIPPKNKPRKRDLKINSSDVDLTKLFQESAYLHQKKRTFNLRNRSSRVHHKVENVKEEKEKNEEVHFLFARETPRFIKYCRKRAKNERTRAKKKRDSELKNDIYGFQKHNASMDQHQYRMSCFNFIDTDKIPFKKLRRGLHRKTTPPQPVEAQNCACKHHAMKVLNSTCEFGKSSSIYYNLGTHPRRSRRKRDYVQEEGFGRERSRCMTKDETVEVSPSSLGPVSISCRDAGTGISRVEFSPACLCRPPCVREKSPALDNVTITSECNQEPSTQPCTPKPGAAQNKCRKKRNKMKKAKFIPNVPQGFFSRFAKHITEFHTKNRLNTGESCIKYVFLGLLIVVWSPCLLAVILAWVVMFPVNVTNILKTDKSKRSRPMNHSLMNRFSKKDPRCEYQRMCFETYLPKNKRSFISSATNWYSRTVGTVVNTLTSLLRLKKKAPTGAGSSFLSSSHPNPRKRYSLFYADKRGWVMKPLRRRNTRSSASTRVVQSMRCEVRPKLRCHKKLPQKFKKVCPFPVNADDSCPRHTSSAAGDACPLKCTHPWPGCVCWDKYSQGSSMFTRLDSRHHRHQKVNIPPTFSYPTSGIAFNLADKIINAEQFNSNGIADNIAREDLVKYHLGQRKNGTLPFGLVFNHPPGSKHPLITNLETFRAHKFGLAGKTLNISTKCTPSLVIKGLQGHLPKFWNKHESGKAAKKSPGVHRITSFTDVTNSMPTKHISSYRQNTKREEALTGSGRNHNSAKNNKKLHTAQKSLNFRNKCVSADIPQSMGTKLQKKTNKINYAHKIQNTPKHIPYHKVSKKTQEAEKTKHDMTSKCAKHDPPKQTCKYKTRVPTQKHSNPAKIKTIIKSDTVLNYSFRKKRKQSKLGYKYNPDQISVATQNQSNKADITTNTNRNKALNNPSGGKHKQTKQANKYKPHQISVVTQKQSNKGDITTSTNVDIALNCPRSEKHEQSTQANKYIPHQVPVATQKQLNKADITTSTNVDIALNCPCSEKHEQSTQANKYIPHQVPVATQKRSNKADITTSTNVDIALNCPCGENHEQSTQAHKDKPHQVPVGTQRQSNKADITTSTNFDIALNCPCGEKHEQSTQANKYIPHQVPVATQKRSNKADITTSTNVDIALNCPCGEKHEQSTQANKYIPHQVPVAYQKRSNKADITTSTNVDIALNCPCGENHEQSTQVNKYKPYQVSVATQKQSNKSDITTNTNVDKALNFPCGGKHKQTKQAHKDKPHQVPVGTQKQSNKADITTSTNVDIALNCPCSENHEQSTQANKYIPHQVPVATQKRSNKADITTNTNVDIALNCPCGENQEQSTQANKYKPHQVPVATQKQSNKADITTSTNVDIALNCPCGENHEQSTQANKYKPHQVSVATQKQSNKADITTSTNVDIALNCPCGENHEQSTQANKYKPHQVPVATQKQSNKADITTSTNVDIALNCPCGENHEQSTQANKYKPHQIPVATQKQSNKADITTSTNVDIALNCPCGEKHEQSTQANKYIPHQVPVATQKQSNKADITTSTNVDTVLNCPRGEKHKQSIHGYKHKPHKIPVATQMQSRTADNTTMINHDIALNCPCEEKHEQYEQCFKNEPHQIHAAIQMQSRTADDTTMTNRDIDLNYPCEEKHEHHKHSYKNKSHQMHNAIQMQSRTADNTIMTNHDIALNFPCKEKHGHEICLKNEPNQISDATQIQSKTADNTTMTNRDIAISYCRGEKHEQSKQAYKYQPYTALNYLGAVKRSTANKDILCIPNTADKDTICTHKIRSPEYVPKKRDVSIQKQASKIETSVHCTSDYERSKTKEIVRPEQTVLPKQAYKYKPYKTTILIHKQPSIADIITSTIRDIATNTCVCGEKHEQSKQAYKSKPRQISVATEKQSSKADITTSTNVDIALNCLCGEKHEQSKQSYKHKPYKTTVPIQNIRSTADTMTSTNHDVALNNLGGVKLSTANKEILCIPSTGDKDTICTQKTSSPEYVPKKQDISIQKRASKIETSVYCTSDYEKSQTKVMVRPEPTVFARKSLDCTSCCAAGTSCEKSAPLKQTSSLEPVTPSLVARSLQIGRVSTRQPLSTRQLQTDELLKQFQPHANSPLFGISTNCRRYGLAPQITQVSSIQVSSSQFQIAADCRCGVTPQQNMPNMEMEQIATDSKNTYTHETRSAKEPLSQQPRLTKTSSHTLQEQPKSFGIAPDCLCGTNQPIVAEKSLYSKIKGSKSHTAKETQSKSLVTHPLTDGDNLTPHSYQNRSVNKALSSQSSKFSKSPESSPLHLLTSPPTQPEKDSRKINDETEAQAEYPQNLSIEQPKVSEQSRQYSSQTTPLTDRQGPTSGQVTAHPHKSHIVTETAPTTSTDIQELPCDCTCDCNSIQRVRSKSPQHLPSAQPDISKIDSFHRSSQLKQSSFDTRKTTLGTDVQPDFSQHLPSAQPDISKIDSFHRSSQPNQASLRTRKTTLGTDGEFPQHLPSMQPDIPKVDKTLSEFQKSPEHLASKMSQANSTLFGIASDCPCGVSPPIGQVLNPLASKITLGTDGQPELSHYLPSALPNISKIDSLHRSSQSKQSSLRTRKTTKGTDGEFSQHLPSLQPDIPKVYKTLSKFAKSPEHLASKMSQANSTVFGIASDCPCGVSPPIGQVSNPLVSKTTLETDGQPEFSQHLPSVQPDIPKVEKTLSNFPKSLEHLPPKVSQATSPMFGITTHCLCGVTPQQNERNQTQQIKTYSKKTNTRKNSSAKAPPSQQSKVTQGLSHSLQEQPKLFGVASDCTCGTNQPIAAENNLYKVTGSKSHTPKKTQIKSPPTLKKSSISPLLKSLPHKCQCPVDTLHDPVGEPPYGTKVSKTSSERNIVKVDKTRSKFPKSPNHSPPPKSLPHKCLCSVESLQAPVGEQPYGTKITKTFSKRKSMKIDKTQSKFPKSPEHSPPQKNLLHNCPYSVESLQDSVNKKTSQRSRKSFFTRKSKRRSLDFPHECPCSSSHNDLDKRCFESDISVLRNTTRPFSIRSRERTEGTCSVNEPSSRVQYRSKVSRLFMSLRCKLFSRKISKQTKIPENPTEKPRSVNFSSLQVIPKKVDKSHSRILRHGQQSKTLQRSSFSPYLSKTCPLCHYPYDDTENISLHTRKSMLDESNRSLFRRSHIMSKTSQNPSLAIHSSHSRLHNSCSCVIRQSSSRQSTKKTRCNPLLVDKSYSCIRVSKTSQRPSFITHSSKLECRCHADNTSSLRLSKISRYSYPRLSQRIRSQQSKKSEDSSIVMSPIECTSDETFSTPNDGMPHQILKTLFKRKSHSKSQHRLTQQNISQFSAYRNRSQETLSEKQSILTQFLSLSHTIIPGMCKYAAKHLGKTTSRQSNSRPQQLNHQHFNQSRQRTSAQKQYSKKFYPQYSSSLNNYQPMPTAKQTVPSQHPLSPEPLKSKRSSLFNHSKSKLLVEKIRSITDKISLNSRKYKEDKTSSTVSAQTALTFSSKCACWPENLHQLSNKLSQLTRRSVENTTSSKPPPHLLTAQNPKHISIRQPKVSEQSRQPEFFPPLPSVCVQPNIPKIYSLHRSSQSKQLTEKVEKQLDAIPLQPQAKQIIPILSGTCRCAGEQKIKTEYSSSHKLQLITDLQELPSTQPSRSPNSHNLPTDTQKFPPPLHSTRISTLGTDGQLKLSQHHPSVQPDISKIDSLHRSSQSKLLTKKVEKQFDAIPQQREAKKVIPILPGKCTCAAEQKVKTERPSNNKLQQIQSSHSSGSHSLRTDNQRFQTSTGSHSTRKTTLGTDGQPKFSQHLLSVQPDISKIDSFHRNSQSKQLTVKVEKQFDAIPQQLEAEQVIPILSGKCRCAGEQKVKTERTSNNKLQQIQHSHLHNSHNLRTDNQRFQSPTASHPTRKNILGTDKQPEFSQHLRNQPLETPASKLSQSHPSQQAVILTSPLHNSQPKRKRPCKCRSSKNGNEPNMRNSLRKITKAQSPEMSHYSSDKFQKSHLISCVYPVNAKKKRLRKHVIIQSSEILQSSENPQFQPNQQIQVYQQNLQYQKRLSQIPTNLDKPPPGLLQQYSPGLGRTTTAEGGVQQPYPDFNRVFIRYPGHNSPHKQSEPNPGLNRQPPTNSNPPAPRATPPTKYARDPCYTNPANRCAPKSPYDESALRRAYKRRPLRYTPPRQQLPRVVMENKLRENKLRAAAAKKRKAKRCRKKTFFQCLRDLINQTEREAWPTDVTCHPMWVNALKQRPCFWIYKTWPRMYPAFLNFYKYQQYIRQMFVYILTLCFWSPLLLCGYFCCDIMCKGC